MKIEMTPENRLQLSQVILDAKTNRKNELKKLSLILLVVLLLGLLFLTWKNIPIMSSGLLLLGYTGFLLLFFVGFSFADGYIRRLERDLVSGIKLIGNSAIIKINPLSRKVKLMDGAKAYESDEEHGLWKKGDIIHYEMTLSGEHFFVCKRSKS